MVTVSRKQAGPSRPQQELRAAPGPAAGGGGSCRRPAQGFAGLEGVLEGGSQALPPREGPGVEERSGGWCAEPGQVLRRLCVPSLAVLWP